MRKKYVVELTKEHSCGGPAPGDREIAGMLETSSDTVGRVRERFFRPGA